MIQTETSKAKIIFLDRLHKDIRIIGIEDGFWEKKFYDKPPKKTAQKLMYNYYSPRIMPTMEYNACLEESYIDLPQGNWAILNTLDEVTEDEAETIVSKYIDYYPLYIKEGMTFSLKTTAKKSVESLATSLGVQGKTIILYELK